MKWYERECFAKTKQTVRTHVEFQGIKVDVLAVGATTEVVEVINTNKSVTDVPKFLKIIPHCHVFHLAFISQKDVWPYYDKLMDEMSSDQHKKIEWVLVGRSKFRVLDGRPATN